MCWGDVLGKVKGVRSTSRLGTKFLIERKFYPVASADRTTFADDCPGAKREWGGSASDDGGQRGDMLELVLNDGW